MTRRVYTLRDVKAILRNGKYVWPGGYPLYFVTADGGVLSFEAVKSNWREVVSASLSNDTRSGWLIAGHDINWEDTNLVCDHTGKPIESAYGEPDESPDPMPFKVEGVDTDDGSRTVLAAFDNSAEAIAFMQRYVAKEDAGGWHLIEVYDTRGEDAERLRFWERDNGVE